MSCKYEILFILINLYTASGTHLSNTKEAGEFALVSEEGIAKGVRRVTALTTNAAKEAIHQSTLFSTRIDEASKLEGPALEKVNTLSRSFPDTGNQTAFSTFSQPRTIVWLTLLRVT